MPDSIDAEEGRYSGSSGGGAAAAAARIVIVLVRPTDARNVGAAVRAAANFGAAAVRVVGSKVGADEVGSGEGAGEDGGEREAEFCRLARVAATGGAWQQYAARGQGALPVFGTLAAAVADCSLVVGTTGKARGAVALQPFLQSAAFRRAMVAGAGSGARGAAVAFVFGCESNGLARAELDYSHALVRIESTDQYGSLNLAQAVLLVLYAVVVAAEALERSPQEGAPAPPAATTAQLDGLLARLEARLAAVAGGRMQVAPVRARAVAQLRQMLGRATISAEEIGLLESIFAALARPPKK